MTRKSAFWCIVLCAWLEMDAAARAADEARVDAAISKGQIFLTSKLKELTGPQKSFAAYALIKTGMSKSQGDIRAATDQAAQAAKEHFASGKPRYGHEIAYTVPCHMFLLEAVDPVAYKSQLEGMAKYLVEHQQANGSWFYSEVTSDNACDTSQTQFALLGLWCASRANIDVSIEAYQKAAHWLLESQMDDGGFAYQPHSGSKPHERETTLSTTLAGSGSLLVVRQVFYPDKNFGEDLAQASRQRTKKHGVLERMQDEQEKGRRLGEIDIPVTTIDKSISRSLKVVGQRFTNHSHFQMYLFYAMERLAALLNAETLVQRDWYAHASDELVRLQTANGSWSDTSGPVPATSFAILCLGKATAQTMGRAPGKKIGGGLLAGARGLPDDLSKLQLKDGQAVERKSKGDVDDLLAELEKTQDVSVTDVQKAILESVNLDDRDQLVGQFDRLRRLAADPRAEVRKTALWAIGRSGEIRLAGLLIAGLEDVDAGVIQEASYGLTVLSRKPTGLVDDKGKAVLVDPLEGIEEDATDEQRQQHLERWLSVALPLWKKWYFSVRPYDERDDRQQLQKKR